MRTLNILIICGILMIPLIAHSAHVPEHLTGKVTDCSVGITWNANPEPDIGKYYLFMSKTPNIDPAKPETYSAVTEHAHPPPTVPCASAGATVNGQWFMVGFAENTAGLGGPTSSEVGFFLQQPPSMMKGLDVN